MQIKIIENCYPPVRSETPSILMKGSLVELDADDAQQLIDKGYAVELKPAKPAKSETPDDTWTVPELKKYAEEKKVDLKGASSKSDILAALKA